MVMFLSALSFASCSMAQSAESLDSTGMQHFNRAFYELVPKHQTEEAAREFTLAENAFCQAIEQNPEWVEPYLHLGRALFVQKKYAQAAEIYSKAAAIAPGRQDIQLQLASALEKAGDYHAALRVLENMRSRQKGAGSQAVLDDLILKMKKRAREE